MSEEQDIADQLIFETEEEAQNILNIIAPGHKIEIDKNNNAIVTGSKYKFVILRSIVIELEQELQLAMDKLIVTDFEIEND